LFVRVVPGKEAGNSREILRTTRGAAGSLLLLRSPDDTVVRANRAAELCWEITMGTYMSASIEYDRSDTNPAFTNSDVIDSLADGSFIFDKDYEVFDALGYGRQGAMSDEDKDPSKRPLIVPRGMPKARSLSVARAYFNVVAEPSGLPDEVFWPAHRCISSLVADEWIQKGATESTVEQSWNTGRPIDHPIIWRAVSDRYWYNASWLHPAEYEAALAHHALQLDELPDEYNIIHFAMKLFEQRLGRDRVRLVLWFS